MNLLLMPLWVINMKFKILVLLLCCFTSNAFAFSVDKMILIADDYNNGVFTITSTSNKPEYVSGFINKIEISNGELKKVKLDKDNLPLWDMALIPNRIILNPGEKRRIALKNLCQINCINTTDRMYQIVLLPVTEQGEAINSVGINLGYAPIFIIPADKSKVSYQTSLQDNKLRIVNHGNTLLFVNVDMCNESVKQNCTFSYTVLSGRDKSYPIPKALLQHGPLKLKIANHDYSYNEIRYVDAK